MFKKNQKKSHPQNNCYVAIASIHPTNPPNLIKESVEKGELDKLFVSKTDNDQPNSYFFTRCAIYNSLEEAIQYSTSLGKTLRHIFILAMNCSSKDLIKLTAQGKFSSGIDRIYDHDEIIRQKHLSLGKH